MNKIFFKNLKKHKNRIILASSFIIVLAVIGISVFAFNLPKFFSPPNFPTRLKNIVIEISEISDELVSLNEKLLESTRNCNCGLAKSLCMPKGLIYGKESECKPLKASGWLSKGIAFGQVCPEQAWVDQGVTETKISHKIDRLAMQISYLDRLLEKEKESGLKKQLDTLRDDDAELFRNSLAKLEILKDIVSIASSTALLPTKCSASKCEPNCGLGQGFGVEACVKGWSGEQKPLQINVKFGVSFSDLDLGNVTIKNVNLNLPDKLKIDKLPKLKGFSVDLPKVHIRCPNQKKVIKIQTPRISMPEFPLIEFCPKPGSNRSSSYDFGSVKQENVKDINRLWYLETNNWLMEKCFSDLKWMDDIQNCQENVFNQCRDKCLDECSQKCNAEKKVCYNSCPKEEGLEKTKCENNCEQSFKICLVTKCNLEQEDINKCVDECTEKSNQCDPIIERQQGCQNEPQKVISLIKSRCQELWNRRCIMEKLNEMTNVKEKELPEIPDICKTIRYSCGINNNKIPSANQCKNLFKSENLPVPANCQYKIKQYNNSGVGPSYSCDYNETYEGNHPKNYFCFPNNFNPIEIIKQKCEEIKKQKKENVPEQCKNLPLYTEVLEEPTITQEYELGGLIPPSSNTITNYPNTSIIKNCPKNERIPSIPKITFKPIEIPDIITPDFNFKPFIEVNVPDIIIEDIQIPDINLCDLNDCQFKFPYLSFKIPSFKIPSIGLPPISIPGYPDISIEMEDINFPDLKFEFPDLINLFSFVEPDLDLDLIKEIPKPKFNWKIGGIEGIDVVDLLLGLFKVPSLKLPNLPSGCASIGIRDIPLKLNFPDFHWEWPEIPKIPEIPFCKNIREYCKKANSFIKQITERADEIQKEVDKTFGEEVQNALDEVAKEINKKIKEKTEDKINEIAMEIKKQIDENLDKYMPEIAKEIIERSKKENQGVPMPGVWRIGEVSLPCENIPPIVVPPLGVSEISFSEISLRDEITALRDKTSNPKLKTVLNWLLATEIPITWPNYLKKINLTVTDRCLKTCDKTHDKIQKLCRDNKTCLEVSQNKENYDECKRFCNEKKGLTYAIGKIPLSRLSFSKEIPIDLPGFQLKKPKFNFKIGGGVKSCVSKPPGGGNPCPVAEIQQNLKELERLNNEIKPSLNEIIKLLQ